MKYQPTKLFIVTDDLISQLFVVTFVYSTYMQIALICAFQCNLACEKWSTSCGNTSWMKFVTISLTNLSQSGKSSSSFIWLNFFYTYISATSPLSQARIAMILLSDAITLLLLRNNQISLYHSLNLIWLPSNYPRSGTILFGITAYSI